MASWLGNWELDVAVENLDFAQKMEQMYLEDLENSTEIVLNKKNRVRPVHPVADQLPRRTRRQRAAVRRRSGSASRLTAGALRVGNTVGAAITSRLVLGAAEAKIMFFGGTTLLALTAMALFEPLLMVIPFSLLAGWIGISLLIQAYRLHRNGQNDAAAQSASIASDEAQDKVIELPNSVRESQELEDTQKTLETQEIRKALRQH
ncbi:MAG TPA: cardiolipin synthase B, partial [Terriglobia bacterium]|nr:cardiolipin synthase B [Terriglobia bacterium]